MIARLKSSFSEMFEDLYLRGLIPSPICESCGKESETVEHFLNYCPNYINQRTQLYVMLMKLRFKGLIQKYRFHDLTIGTPELEADIKKLNKKEAENFYTCIKNYIRKLNH